MESLREVGPPDSSGWHPDLQALYRYWRGIHPASGLPGRQHLDPVHLKTYLPRIWLVDLQADPFRVRYRLVGTRIVELAGRELTGLWLDEAHPEWAAGPGALDRFKSVAASGVPNHSRGRPRLSLAAKADFIEVENVYYPLASDGRMVDVIMSYTVFYASDGTTI